MDTTDNPGPEILSKAMAGVFPAMDSHEQALALTLYRLLAAGEPVSPAELAHQVGFPVDQVSATLKNWPGVFFDTDQRVTGFWGLSLQETVHRLVVDDVTLYSWCAWSDSY